MARTKKRLRWVVLVCVSVALLWQRVRTRRPRHTDPYTRRADTATPRRSSATTEGGRDGPPPAVADAGAQAADAPATAAPAGAASGRDDVPTAVAGEIDLAEAARILGCSSEEASALLDGRSLTRSGAEEIAVEHYRWRRHVDDPDSYWVTLKQASTILGVPAQHVKQMLENGEVPFVVHRDGVRLMRRAELAR